MAWLSRGQEPTEGGHSCISHTRLAQPGLRTEHAWTDPQRLFTLSSSALPSLSSSLLSPLFLSRPLFFLFCALSLSLFLSMLLLSFPTSVLLAFFRRAAGDLLAPT